MRFQKLYKTLEKHKYFIFSYDDILSFYPNEKKENLKKMLFRWCKKGWIYHLKRGLYELSFPADFMIPDFYIANKLYNPSYISLETALSDYSIIPEVSMAVTSITTKPTRRFKNKHGLFIYKTIKPKVFTGYYLEKQDDFNILIAEPEKAFIDYLYFNNYPNKKVSLGNQRFDKEKLKSFKKKKLNKYARLYNLNLGELYANL